MARYARKSAILAKIESSYGSDASPSGAANAILVSNITVNPLNAQNVNRDLIRSYFGGSEQLVGTAYIELSFDVELAGSGDADTPTAWGPLLEGCGFAETINAAQDVEYNPVSDSLDSLTIYYYDDGVLHKALGCMGSFDINLGVSNRPVLSFTFMGLDGGISATSTPSLTLTAFSTPQVVTDTNTTDIKLGCTYSAGISGGTAYASQGVTISMGNDVQFTPLLGGETVDIVNRDVTGSVNFDLTAANEVSFMANVKANTTQALGVEHGTATGNKVLIFAPAVQLLNPSKQDVNGRRLIGYDLRFMPSSGNDEIKIVTK